MKKEYDIEKVIELRDSQNLKWKEIEEIIGVSAETLRKAYKRKKEGLSCTEANLNNYPKQKQRGLLRKIQLINEFGGKCQECKYKSKNYPSIEEVNEQYEILHSWEKVANHFNLTRRIIQGIRNRVS